MMDRTILTVGNLATVSMVVLATTPLSVKMAVIKFLVDQEEIHWWKIAMHPTT
jgi:hypothetical protein